MSCRAGNMSWPDRPPTLPAATRSPPWDTGRPTTRRSRRASAPSTRTGPSRRHATRSGLSAAALTNRRGDLKRSGGNSGGVKSERRQVRRSGGDGDWAGNPSVPILFLHSPLRDSAPSTRACTHLALALFAARFVRSPLPAAVVGWRWWWLVVVGAGASCPSRLRWEGRVSRRASGHALAVPVGRFAPTSTAPNAARARRPALAQPPHPAALAPSDETTVRHHASTRARCIEQRGVFDAHLVPLAPRECAASVRASFVRPSRCGRTRAASCHSQPPLLLSLHCCCSPHRRQTRTHRFTIAV